MATDGSFQRQGINRREVLVAGGAAALGIGLIAAVIGFRYVMTLGR